MAEELAKKVRVLCWVSLCVWALCECVFLFYGLLLRGDTTIIHSNDCRIVVGGGERIRVSGGKDGGTIKGNYINFQGWLYFFSLTWILN